MEVDLHIHTTASDGTNTPKEVIELAIRKNLKAISITDHDNIDGLFEAIEHARTLNFELINGIEFSCNIEEKEVHILGYFLNLEDKIFLNRINNLLESRNLRNKKIVELLNKNGIIIEFEDIKREATGNIIGRVHFAKALIKKGYCSTIEEAFNKFLKKGSIAYVPICNCSPETVVNYLKENGAFSSLAHPKLISEDDNFVLELLKNLKKCGLNGLEVNYSSFSNEDKKKYKAWAKKYGLIITGGSDFHGENRKNVDIGEEGLSYEQFLKIKEFMSIN